MSEVVAAPSACESPVAPDPWAAALSSAGVSGAPSSTAAVVAGSGAGGAGGASLRIRSRVIGPGALGGDAQLHAGHAARCPSADQRSGAREPGSSGAVPPPALRQPRPRQCAMACVYQSPTCWERCWWDVGSHVDHWCGQCPRKSLRNASSAQPDEVPPLHQYRMRIAVQCSIGLMHMPEYLHLHISNLMLV